MQTPAARPIGKWIPGVLALLLIAGVAMVGCDTPGPTPTRKPTTAPAAETRTSAPPLVPTAVPTSQPPPTAGRTETATPVPRDAPARVIPLPSGGSLTVPQGALPRSAQVLARLACTPPLEGHVEAVGETVAIGATDEPARALTLRLPTPAGAADPDEFAIVRVEPDGATTFLMTELEGEELVAATPGFGTFVAVQLKSGSGLRLSGPTTLVPDETAVVAPLAAWPLVVRDGTWSARGAAKLVQQGSDAAVVKASAAPDWGEVSYQFLDSMTGLRFYGCRSIEIATGPLAYGGQPFKVSVSPVTPVVYAGKEVRIGAELLGAFERPITWSWDFGDGQIGGPETSAEDQTAYDLPAKRYSTEDPVTDYEVTVTARDARGREGRGSTRIRVMIEEIAYQARLEGPLRLAWTGKSVSAAYTLTASGGVPPHTFQLFQYPGTGWRSGSGESWAQRLEFPEPGEYRLIGMARDSESAQYRSYPMLRVVVEGGEPLSVDLKVAPGSASLPASADVQVRGGVLVVAGKKAGYRVTLDWGDGSEPLVEEGVGEDSTSAEGAFLPKTHNYARPGTYTVRVEVCDAAGRSDVVAKELVIPDWGAVAAPATATRTPTRTPTRKPQVGPTHTDTPTPTRTRTPTRTPTPTRTRTRTPTPTRATRTPTPTPTETDRPTGRILVWVRQDNPVVNVNNDPKVSTPPEPRWAGSISEQTVSAIQFTTRERYVDKGDLYFDVTITCDFKTPPLVLNPTLNPSLPSRYPIECTFSWAGENPTGEQGLGETFRYSMQRGYEGYIDPSDTLGWLPYYPFSATFDGTKSKTWMVTAPPIGKLGDTFQMYAGLHNRNPCNVTWTYKVEYH